jgi:hypothetical protein
MCPPPTSGAAPTPLQKVFDIPSVVIFIMLQFGAHEEHLPNRISLLAHHLLLC